MSGKYLLDTSIIIELFAQDNIVVNQLDKAESTFIPSIAVGELHYGARKSAREKENLSTGTCTGNGVSNPANGDFE